MTPAPAIRRSLLRRQHADFDIHGHRWSDPAGAFIDNPAMGPNESVTARLVEDDPQVAGSSTATSSRIRTRDGGRVRRRPLTPERDEIMRTTTRVAPLAALAIAALLAPAAA